VRPGRRPTTAPPPARGADDPRLSRTGLQLAQGDGTPFGRLNKIRDLLALVSALSYRTVNVVGHDAGSPLAGWCALARPDVFRTAVMSSAPYGGPPALPFRKANAPAAPGASPADPNAIYADLATLTPPRKHYQRYYQTAKANENLWHPTQGLHAFRREGRP
jgi:pimeloyl-ACP methyl ester carboxylesterase